MGWCVGEASMCISVSVCDMNDRVCVCVCRWVCECMGVYRWQCYSHVHCGGAVPAMKDNGTVAHDMFIDRGDKRVNSGIVGGGGRGEDEELGLVEKQRS